MQEIYYFMISYLIIIFGGMMLLNFISNGFLLAFIKTKAGRGRKVLTIIKSPLEFYASKGWIEGNRFKWYDNETKRKEKNKIAKALDIEEDKPSPFFRLFGVPVVFIDEATNLFINFRAHRITGNIDALNQENMIMWALQRPAQQEKLILFLIILIIVCIISLFVVGFVAYKVNMLQTLIQGIRAINPVNAVNIGGAV